jgi:hypothetical protein
MEKTTKQKTSYLQISINTNASKVDSSIIRDINWGITEEHTGAPFTDISA